MSPPAGWASRQCRNGPEPPCQEDVERMRGPAETAAGGQDDRRDTFGWPFLSSLQLSDSGFQLIGLNHRFPVPSSQFPVSNRPVPGTLAPWHSGKRSYTYARGSESVLQ